MGEEDDEDDEEREEGEVLSPSPQQGTSPLPPTLPLLPPPTPLPPIWRASAATTNYLEMKLSILIPSELTLYLVHSG